MKRRNFFLGFLALFGLNKRPAKAGPKAQIVIEFPEKCYFCERPVYAYTRDVYMLRPVQDELGNWWANMEPGPPRYTCLGHTAPSAFVETPEYQDWLKEQT